MFEEKVILCGFICTALTVKTHAQQADTFSFRQFQKMERKINQESYVNHQKMMKLLHIDSLRPGANPAKSSTNPLPKDIPSSAGVLEKKWITWRVPESIIGFVGIF